ncbi:hypothetical protein KAR91_80845 [Candidatus Pacearchaeota archaeon]|nr:hypothetical protein [Candidatus Pacearchaeota archaeon]
MINIDTIKQDVEQGNIDALEAYVLLKGIEKELKDSLNMVQEFALQEAEKYGQSEFEAFGASINLKNGPGRWNYKELPWWNTYQLEQDAAKEAYKMSQKGQKLITDDGEVIIPAQFTPGKLVLSVRIK